MRGFIFFIIVAVLGLLFLRQKHNEPAPTGDKAAATQPAATKATPAPLTPAPRGQASEHNYMKRALDRARDVTEQSRARTDAAQQP
jgi:hypothetical protein